MDTTVIDKIKKCLDKAHHASASDAEVKAALHVANRCMARYNVTQAEILAHEPPAVQKQYGGQSFVHLRRTDKSDLTPPRVQTYAEDICIAMGIFFDCKGYITLCSHHVQVAFAGIAENTVAAAMS